MKLFIGIFLFFGLGSMAACLILTYYNVSFLSTAKETPAEVIRLDDGRDSEGHIMYYPVFQYTSDQGEERTYASNSGSSPAAYSVGEKTTLLIGENGNVRQTGFIFWLAPFITGLFGLIFGGVGGGFWYAQHLQQKKKEYLLQFGKKIKAKVVQLDYNSRIKMNGRHPDIVVCEADLSGRTEIFRSHNLWNGVRIQPGDVVDVYVDPRDTKKYWVSVE